MSKIERTHVTVPDGFSAGKIPGLTLKVREKTGADDWKFESYLPAEGKVTFTREEFMVEVLEVEYTGGGTAKRVSGLPANTRPSDGDRLAAVYEEANPELRSHRDGIGRLTLPRKGEASHSACRCVTVREESSGSQT